MIQISEGEQGFWPSYADMMSAVALILFFLMLLSYIQNLITGNNLRNTEEDLLETRVVLTDTQTELKGTRRELTDTQNELSDTQLSLSATQVQLSDTQSLLASTRQEVKEAEEELSRITGDLEEARSSLEQQTQELEEQKKELEEQDKLLAEQRSLLSEQEQYMRTADQELRAMRSQMQTIAVLRLSILEQIRYSVAEVMGDASRVSIGSNGNIILSESILFDLGSAEIKEEAAPALDQLINVFRQFLQNDDNAKYVDSVVISGHTDSTGTEVLNRTLSTERANSVLNYLLENDNGALNGYEQFFCAAGYGQTRPVADNATAEGRAANRRIEISIILRDDSVMDIVESYLDIDVPEVP